MTKVMLIVGVAALAITTPAVAGPHGDHGGGPRGGNHAAPAERQNGGGGGHANRMPDFARARPQEQRAPRMDFAPRGGGRQMAEMQHAQVRMERQQAVERQQVRREAMQNRTMQRQVAQQQSLNRQAMRNERAQRQAVVHEMADRRSMQHQQAERQAMQRQMLQREAMQHQQVQRQAMQHQMLQRRAMQHQQLQREAMQHQMLQREAMQRQMAQRQSLQQARAFQQQQRADRLLAQNRALDRQQQVLQLRQQQQADRMAESQLRNQRYADLRQMAAARRMNELARNQLANRYRTDGRDYLNGCPPGLAAKENGCLPPGQAMKLLGSPVSRAASYASLAAVPMALRSMYPESPDHYYRYGDGYLYSVNRNNDVIDSLMPLVGGGYVPGMTFPTAYMNSYVPDYYGMNSFYPDTSYADYRYLDGNVYSVDPYSGTIEDVIPTYAYGYGVGQMLPAGYGYYNVPSQYRTVYYNTPDSNYWYAPGAIYQVDPNTQLITSVASLLAPGLTIGQPLPMGYSTYNVPLSYRSTYYDTPDAWYRYNNGYIYQVDPTTQLVRAIVASLLT